MTRIEHLNHVMQKLQRKGLITSEEYETHNEMIHAVEALDGMVEVFNKRYEDIDGLEAPAVIERARHFLEKLK